MRRVLALAVVWMSIAADCELGGPCDDYVDYMCTCHADDPDFDCEELQTVFANADPELQDQCAIDLAAQQDEDEANGEGCVAR